MQRPTTSWLQIALQKLKPLTISTYASCLRTLARLLSSDTQSLSSQLVQAIATYSTTVSPTRVWTMLSALSWATRLQLLPPLDLTLARAVAQGNQHSQPTPIRQLWFHPSDLGILSNIDLDFETAGNLCFDLMLRGGQLERLTCGNLDYTSQSVWCPPHKNVLFPYLRKPQQHIWTLLCKLHNGRPATQKLFSRTAKEYSDLLAKHTEATLHLRYTWHSLRRGGAIARAHQG